MGGDLSGGMGGGMGGQQSSFGNQGGGGMAGRGQTSSFGGQGFWGNNDNNMMNEANNNMMSRREEGGGMMQQQQNMMSRGGGGGGMMQQQQNMMGGGGGRGGRTQQQQNMMGRGGGGGGGGGGGMMQQQKNVMGRGNNDMMGQGRMAQGNRMGQNNNMGQGNNDLMGGGQQQFQQRLSNGYGLSMEGGFNDDYDDYESSQPIFGQQYYGRQGNSEDFRQASRYTLPRNRQALGDYDSSYISYKDDSGLRERRLRGYRMNGRVNDFGWQRGSSENFRQVGKRMSGSSTSGLAYGGNTRGRGGQSDYTPRERELRQRQFDRNDYDDDIYRGRGSNSIRDFRGGGPISSNNRNQDRGIRDGNSNRNDFRERGNRQIGRQGGYDKGIDSRDDDYYDDFGYEKDNRRSARSNGRSGYDRREDDRKLMNNNGGIGNDRRDDNRSYGNDRRDDVYYDPEVLGKNNRRESGKRSVWDNIRDAFGI